MNREERGSRAFTGWISGAALGALAMYLSDPDRGKRRRALAKDKMRSMMIQASDSLDVASRDMSNRMRGLRAEASKRMSQRNKLVSDAVLVERVRSKIGRTVSHPHSIKVRAEQGCVTLSGAILASELEQTLAMVRAVPGVMTIEDHMEVHERADTPSLQGQGRPRQQRSTIMRENWPPALRAVATIGGGALGAYGLIRRSPGSIMLAALGIGLMARGMGNAGMRRMTGMQAGMQPVHLQKSIYIAAPPASVFDLWSNYENFPHFMSNVQEVRDLGGGRSHWIVSGPAGSQVEWDAMMTESRRPEMLAWKSEPNATVENEGTIRFEQENGGTRVHVQMIYSPPAGVVGHAIASLFNGNPKRQMDEDLMRMKSFIESGAQPRGAAQPTQPTAIH
ncbi:SRPBCC family protein [Noviherbaspirillum massiliense]|uniref:SRPBCC family protein n=1 Tax=Noviherbaspirillum massiliense TaxID=1465823 RepID=UPI0002FBB3AD|nr:SRPBCC family protein [Noviherbaspirillum massiliense]